MAALLVAGALALGAAACADDDAGATSEDGDEQSTTSTTTGTTLSAEELLGPDDAASGEPVRVGFISDGSSSFVDNSVEGRVAEATVEWLNAHRGGIAGRPIELVPCDLLGEPASSAACGEQLVEEGVTVVVGNEVASAEAAWQPLHDAGIPVMLFSAQDPLTSADSGTFVLSDPVASAVDTPLAVAEDAAAERLTTVIIDVPGAAETLEEYAGPSFDEAGIDLAFLRVPPGTADMTAQLAPLASDGTGAAYVIGNDAFCIAAFNGLRQTGFTGPITSISQCITDATRDAVGDELEGVVISSSTAVGATSDPSVQLFRAVIDEYGEDVDVTLNQSLATFAVVTALHDGLDGVEGEVTSESVVEALSTADEMELHAGLGRTFRCNGKANEDQAAVCTRGTIVTTLDAEGRPGNYSLEGSSEIPD
jgi:branched-chain amino acid transport system substrate-binding protein